MKASFALFVFLLTEAGQIAQSAPEDAGSSSKSQNSTLTEPTTPSGTIHLVAAMAEPGRAPTLIGKSGELYLATDSLRWQRSNAGGVSADVQSIHRSKTGELYAQGHRAPLFKLTAGSWSANPLANRGFSTFSKGTLSIVSAGRHIYQLNAKGWQRIATAPSTLRAIWAKSSKRMYIATIDGKLYVGGKGGWKSLRISLPDTDEVTQLIGHGNLVIALTDNNRIFSIDAKFGARPVPKTGFVHLDIHQIAVLDNKIVIATEGGTKANRQTQLLHVQKKSLTQLESAWSLALGDQFSVLFEDGKGQWVLASQRGQVRVRDADGNWQNGLISTEIPKPAQDFTHSKPARSL